MKDNLGDNYNDIIDKKIKEHYKPKGMHHQNMEPNISKKNKVIRFETKGVSKDGITEINKCIKDWRDKKVIIICDYKKIRTVK